MYLNTIVYVNKYANDQMTNITLKSVVKLVRKSWVAIVVARNVNELNKICSFETFR